MAYTCDIVRGDLLTTLTTTRG